MGELKKISYLSKKQSYLKKNRLFWFLLKEIKIITSPDHH